MTQFGKINLEIFQKILIAKIIFSQIYAKYLASKINPKVSEEDLFIYELYMKGVIIMEKNVNQPEHVFASHVFWSKTILVAPKNSEYLCLTKKYLET